MIEGGAWGAGIATFSGDRVLEVFYPTPQLGSHDGEPFTELSAEAAAEHGLPVAIHVGFEGTGIANPPTAVGYPATYLEFHTDHSQTMMAHCISLISSGVFEEFSSLRFIFVEGGTVWAPYVMGRLDRMYPALKAEVPYLTMRPSNYLLRNCYFSTQPIEEPDDPQHLAFAFDALGMTDRIMFSSDYPFASMAAARGFLDQLPVSPADRERIAHGNAERLLGL